MGRERARGGGRVGGGLAEMEGGKEGPKLFLFHVLWSVSHRCFRERHWQGSWVGGDGLRGGEGWGGRGVFLVNAESSTKVTEREECRESLMLNHLNSLVLTLTDA